MGWFLTKKKKSASKPVARTTKSFSKPAPWDPTRTLFLIRVVVVTVLLAGLGTAWFFGEQALMRYEDKLAKHAPITPEKVKLVNTPAWMSPKLQEEIRTLASSPVTDDPMDREGLNKAVSAVRASPWVADVKRVQRTNTGDLRVWAEYRSPVAAVETEDGCRVVDATGIVLPGVYDKEQGHHLSLPLITRVSNPPPGEGTRWQGEDLKAGLNLLQYLRAQPYYAQIRAFDVGDRDTKGRLRLSLLTRRGMVRWGLPIGEEQTIEPDPSVKRNSIAMMQKQAGAIDAGGKIVDVFGPTINVSMPATDDPTPQAGYTLGR